MRLKCAADVVLELNPILKNALKSCQTSYWGGNCCATNAPQMRSERAANVVNVRIAHLRIAH